MATIATEQSGAEAAKKYLSGYNERITKLPKRSNREINTDYGKVRAVFNDLLDTDDEDFDE